MATRVCIVQPLVPRYRGPVFERLSAVPDLSVEVWADLSGRVGSLEGITASDRIKLRHAPYKEHRGIVWQPAMLQAMHGDFDAVMLPWNIRSPHLFIALAKRRRPPVILWGHGFGTHHERLGGWLRRRAASMAEACMFYGPSSRDQAVAKGLPPDQLFVAPNAVDQELIQAAAARWADPQRRLQALHALGFQDGPFMLYMSRLEPEKRPDLAIEALPAIRECVPDAGLVFVGDGSQRPLLEARVRELGLGRHVRFMGAIHDEDRIAPLALSASLLIHPGALGLSIFHAFGYGLPVVTTDATHLQMPETEALEPGRNGLTFRQGDLADLARVCSRILLDQGLRSSLSAAARHTVLAENGRNIPGMVAGIERAIRFVSQSPHGGRR